MTSRIALITTIAFVSLASAAFAQDADHSRNRGACRDDVQKLCTGIERGGGRIRDCLAGQLDKLSDSCRKMVESRAK
jgi:hypothetical protein